jgi:hypothetical protein
LEKVVSRGGFPKKIMARLFEQVQTLPGAQTLTYLDHRRRAKQRMR